MSPVDAPARATIRSGLDATLFVEAGAGTGKTSELVGRVLSLVRTGRVEMSRVAAITFTDAAAAELRDRLRVGLERDLEAATDPEVVGRLRHALVETELAAVTTVHGFARRILSEHALLAGVPPRFDVLDEVESQLEFDRRYRRFLDELLDRDDLEPLLRRGVLLGVPFVRRRGAGASIRAVAEIFDDQWDRLEAFAALEPELQPLDWTPLESACRGALELRDECLAPDRCRLLARIETHRDEIERLLAADDEAVRLRLLVSKSRWSSLSNLGRRDDWLRPPREVRDDVRAADDAAEELLRVARSNVVERLAVEVARFCLDSASRRAADGRLEFHDLLVLARRLLADAPAVRASLRDRYRVVFLDEFQDTDPIQIDLAAMIASLPEEGAVPRWSEAELEAGRLFLVGDPKQSIYRFRRADIELFLEARRRLGEVGELVELTTNFRTVPAILDWVNEVFATLLDGSDERHPGYRALQPARSASPDGDHRVVLLGGPHETVGRGPTAGELRTFEAADVASLLADIRDHPDDWPVHDAAAGTWRAARLDDVAVLLPTRTALGALEDALAAVDVASRADTGTLVYDTQEVRDLLSILHAVDDPGDSLAVVAALRSPLLGCGDDELTRWARDRRGWDYRRSENRSEGTVGSALDALYVWHQQRWWRRPAEIVLDVLSKTRAFEMAFAERRPRDVWRRYRHVIDAARAHAETAGGNLSSFLEWAELQRIDGARVHEPLVADADDEAVRIMTIHGSKGLEFPIVVATGLSTVYGTPRPGVRVIFGSEAEAPSIRLGRGAATSDFDRAADLEAEMDEAEKQRLLYVAATRARDHLAVTVHHRDGVKPSHASRLWELSEAMLDSGRVRRWEPPESADVPAAHAASADAIDSPAVRAAWTRERDRLLAVARSPCSVAATALHDARIVAAVPVDGDGIDGATLGRAVHEALRATPLADPTRLASNAARAAAAEGIAASAPLVAAMSARALAAPSVVAAAKAPRHWKEVFVAVPVGDVVVEGYVDLVAELAGAGLHVIDYKTDRVADREACHSSAARYRRQLGAYAMALEEATGRGVEKVTLVFCGVEGAPEITFDDVAALRGEVVRGVGDALRP